MDYITRASHKPYQKEEYMYVCIITEDVYKEKMRFIIIGLIWLPLLVNILCVDCVVWSVSTVINDVDDYWHGVEVWRCGCCDTWHQVLLTSDRLGTKHPVRANIISSSFTSSRETPLTAAKPINTSASKPQVTNIWEIFVRQKEGGDLRTILTRSIWNR